MSLTSAWIGRLIMRCLLHDWFNFERFNRRHLPEAEWSHSWIQGMNREKGGGDTSVQHCDSKQDSFISHALTNWASKRVIWWPVYELRSGKMVTWMLQLAGQGEERLTEALGKLKPSSTMTTYFPQTGVESYTEYETSWRQCSLSDK